MSDVLAPFADLPSGVRKIASALFGVGLGRAAWAGGWWGMGALAVMFVLLFVVLALADEALET